MRVALHTRLKPGSERAYDDAHRDVPAELVAAMRRAGARTWRIWRAERDIFQLIECDDYAALIDALRDLPVNVSWQGRMAELQDLTHDYSAAGRDAGLPLVWDLKAQP